jgi:hypothetical protein
MLPNMICECTVSNSDSKDEQVKGETKTKKQWLNILKKATKSTFAIHNTVNQIKFLNQTVLPRIVWHRIIIIIIK